MTRSILICGAEPGRVRELAAALGGDDVQLAAAGADALTQLALRAVDAIVVPVTLSTPRDGLDLLQQIRVLYPTITRFVLAPETADPHLQRARDEGAVEYVLHDRWEVERMRREIEDELAARAAAMVGD